MADTFGAILDKQASEVERPRPLPVGSYVCLVKGQPRQDKSSRKGTEFVEFSLIPQQAGDDVDTEELQTALTRADGSVKSLLDASIRATFYLTDDALWRLKKFLTEDLGIEYNDKSFRQMIGEAAGRQVIANLRHQASEDGQAVFAQLSSTAPVE